MKKIFKELLHSNSITLNHRKHKQTILEIKQAFKPYQIEILIRNELDYFEALIHLQGLKNKQAFEQLFETQRNALMDIWDHLSFQERNRLIQIQLDVIKEKHPFFKTNESKIIWIPFFDPLLNGLYNSDLAILELPQYFKLYKAFKDRRISIRDYQFLPYRYEFIDIHWIKSYPDAIYFYSNSFASIFELDLGFNSVRIALDKESCHVTPFNKDLLKIIEAYRAKDSKKMLEACMESSLIADKVKKSFSRRLSKQK